jgi:hypothetical protein
MLLVPMPARLKLLHVCDQWHSFRVVFTASLTVGTVNHVETLMAISSTVTVGPYRTLTMNSVTVLMTSYNAEGDLQYSYSPHTKQWCQRGAQAAMDAHVVKLASSYDEQFSISKVLTQRLLVTDASTGQQRTEQVRCSSLLGNG